LIVIFVAIEVCRPGIDGGLRFAREASGYAEIEGGGFSDISVSEDDASKSTSVPEEASMGADGAKRVGWTSTALFRFGGGGNAVNAMVALFKGFERSCFD
jgi:hypothetical protein